MCNVHGVRRCPQIVPVVNAEVEVSVAGCHGIAMVERYERLRDVHGKYTARITVLREIEAHGDGVPNRRTAHRNGFP